MLNGVVTRPGCMLPLHAVAARCCRTRALPAVVACYYCMLLLRALVACSCCTLLSHAPVAR
eukprot:1686157-Lingulodinium_polyedra.AAC.1